MADGYPTVTTTTRARCAWCGEPASHTVVEHVENPMRNGRPRKRAHLCAQHFSECMRDGDADGITWDAQVPS